MSPEEEISFDQAKQLSPYEEREQFNEWCAIWKAKCEKWTWNLKWTEPAAFSCNNKGQVFLTVKDGFHNENERFYIEGQSKFLDLIVRECLKKRRRGGRFFVNRRGVYFKESTDSYRFWFLKFV